MPYREGGRHGCRGHALPATRPGLFVSLYPPHSSFRHPRGFCTPLPAAFTPAASFVQTPSGQTSQVHPSTGPSPGPGRAASGIPPVRVAGTGQRRFPGGFLLLPDSKGDQKSYFGHPYCLFRPGTRASHPDRGGMKTRSPGIFRPLHEIRTKTLVKNKGQTTYPSLPVP